MTAESLGPGAPRPHIGLAFGWLLAVPGFVIVASGAIVLTPILGLIGCRLSGILSIRCDSDFVFALVEPLRILVILSGAFLPVGATAILYSLGSAGWRAYARHGVRRSAD